MCAATGLESDEVLQAALAIGGDYFKGVAQMGPAKSCAAVAAVRGDAAVVRAPSGSLARFGAAIDAVVRMKRGTAMDASIFAAKDRLLRAFAAFKGGYVLAANPSPAAPALRHLDLTGIPDDTLRQACGVPEPALESMDSALAALTMRGGRHLLRDFTPAERSLRGLVL